MASSTNHKLVWTPIMFLFILTKALFGLSALMNETVMPQDVFTSKQVVIVNKLGIRETLNVHCKSGEKDLGPVTLVPGARFEFKFLSSNLQLTTYT
ncbi:unnamed protein product [Eruca vesicaria subsp. sativa]|uniref:S-protein homolog n=1 Tax=Eruca vesicaria subsp. sativa TaxID=29727 RepID=A0ABC8M949_ERUVS|nr:unnamed protein product [Eruca vesicaria subsp. sativa]